MLHNQIITDFNLNLRAKDFITSMVKKYKSGHFELPHPNSDIAGPYCKIPCYGKINLFNLTK